MQRSEDQTRKYTSKVQWPLTLRPWPFGCGICLAKKASAKSACVLNPALPSGCAENRPGLDLMHRLRGVGRRVRGCD
jgi:hypothetical protein